MDGQPPTTPRSVPGAPEGQTDTGHDDRTDTRKSRRQLLAELREVRAQLAALTADRAPSESFAHAEEPAESSILAFRERGTRNQRASRSQPLATASQADQGRAYAHLRRQLEFTRAITDSVGHGLVAVDHASRVSFVNPAATSLLGWSTAELLGKDLHEKLHARATACDATNPAECGLLCSLVEAVTTLSERSTFSRRDGTTIPVRYTSAPIRLDGQIIGAVLTFADMTERTRLQDEVRRGNERFQATFEQAAIGVAHVQLDGRWLHVNDKFCSIVGYTRAELLSLTSRDIIYADDLDTDRDLIQQLVEGQIATYTQEKRYIRRDGDLVWVELAISLVRDAAGQPDYFIVLVADIDARKRQEEDRARSLAREQAARIQAEIASRDLRALQTVTDTALSGLHLDDVLRETLDRLTVALAADIAGVLLTVPEDQFLEIRAIVGFAHPYVLGLRIPIGDGPLGRAAAAGTAIVLDDLSSADLALPATRAKARSLLSVPLLMQERVLGEIFVATATRRHFAEKEIQLLQLVADRVAIAIDRARTFDAAQQARREAEERASHLQALFDAMTECVVLVDREGRTLHRNAAYRNLLAAHLRPEWSDLPLDERTRQLAIYSIDGHPIGSDKEPIRRILNGETFAGAGALDLRLQAFDGRTVLVSLQGSPIRNAEGMITGGVAVLRDVTERRAMEQRLAEQAAQLETIFEAQTDAVVLVDRKGYVLRSNQAALRMMRGSFPENWQESPLRNLAHPLDLRDGAGQPFPESETPMRRMLRGELLTADTAVDVRMYAYDGTELLVNVLGAPLRDPNGEIAGAVGVMRDVGKLRALERRTREALEALLAMAQAMVAGDDSERENEQNTGGSMAIYRLAELARTVLGCDQIIVIALDLDTQIYRVGPILGVTPAEERQIRKDIDDIGLLTGLEPGLLAQLRAGDLFPFDFERYPRYARNSLGPLQMFVTPMAVADKPVGILGIGYAEPQEMTGERQALAQAIGKLAALTMDRERLLRERTEAAAQVLSLQETNRRMDEFLSIVSHEIKTPITTFKLAFQSLHRSLTKGAKGPNGEDATTGISGGNIDRMARLADRSLHEIERLEHLVEDLLEDSLIEAGGLRLRTKPCRLDRIVANAVAAQRKLHPERRIELKPAGGALPVVADAHRMGKVIANYIDNALKYSADDQPVVVTAQREGDQARIGVRDQGPGLPHAELRRIWDRYYRAAGAERQGGGLGVGLRYCRAVVEQHGGEVGVESMPGAGSTFWFTLPLSLS